jgi:centractin
VTQLGPERFRAPELLFRPELIGEEFPGLHELLTHSIGRADLDLRRTLYSSIVLSGGSTLFPGTDRKFDTFSVTVFG